MMAPQRQIWAVVSPTNQVLSLQSDEAAAVREGRRRARVVQVDRSVDLGPSLQPNPPIGTRGPELAWNGVGRLRINANRAFPMAADDAHQRLRPYFPQEKGGVPLKAWASPRAMIDNILGQNAKLVAGDLPDAQLNTLRRRYGKEGIDVQGLTLLPNVIWTRLTKSTKRINTCIGASRECAEACLVYSGRNEADPYNTVIKAAKLSALLNEPDAFGAILFQAVRRHLVSRSRYAGFVRLNVFSDIPWELVFPELFENVNGEQLYDYTKVPGRQTPSNYDLTFSYSGRNYEDMLYELRRGRRVAVVFLTEKHHLPSTFLGHPVVDGDRYDARPLDPAPSIVGLAYKRPKKKGVKVSTTDNVFVVPVHELDGQLVAAITPREQPGVAEHLDEDAVPRNVRLPVLQNRKPNMIKLSENRRRRSLMR
jgi:hypothetical protein